MSDLSGRLLDAARSSHNENCQDVEPFIVVAVLRELDRIYHELDSSFEQLDVAVLADEIEQG